MFALMMAANRQHPVAIWTGRNAVDNFPETANTVGVKQGRRDELPAADAENPPARHKPVGKRKKADGGRAKRKPNEALVLEMLHELARELGQDRSTDE